MAELQPRPKQAACLVCRRSKTKCDWMPYEARCRRCINLNSECIRPELHPGRQKGIKNKRVGLEKALYQIQQAIQRVKTGELRGSEDRNVVSSLRQLLDEVYSSDAAEHSSRQASQSCTQDNEGALSSSDEDDEGDTLEHRSISDFGQYTEAGMAIDDAENPLQLLARASYFQPSGDSRCSRYSPQNSRQNVAPKKQSPESAKIQQFFSQARVKLDVGQDLDPIDLGLVTLEEAESLFSFFHNKLAHTRWGLDPRVYDVSFTRSRSAFLFTSVMAASTLFVPTADALSKRLFNHVKLLGQKVITHKYKSVEIVLAFLANIPWMFPGEHSTDDETCTYISMATTIAIDLSLHKVLIPIEKLESGSTTVSRGECLDPRTALLIDGFPDVDPWSERGQFLLRGGERCYISLFVAERGMCLARGRPFVVPISRLIKDCDNWHRSSLADTQDGHVTSMAVLRRNLDGLFNTVRALCDGSQNVNSDGSLVAQSIQSAIERFFDQWYTEWGVMIGIGPERRLPPYVEILVTHTRLSTYGGVINHPTAPVEVRCFFRTAGLSSALNVMRAAIQGESQLQSMPNNTAIMISFAACFALTLSAYATDGSALAPSIRKLIDEAAGVLERIGTVTKHRNGLSVLYGKHLRHLLKKSGPASNHLAPAVPPTAAPEKAHTSTEPMPVRTSMPPAADFMDQPLLWPETLQFSTMSDDQIAQVLSQPGNVFEPSSGGLSWEDMNNFDWLHWPAFGAG